MQSNCDICRCIQLLQIPQKCSLTGSHRYLADTRGGLEMTCTYTISEWMEKAFRGRHYDDSINTSCFLILGSHMHRYLADGQGGLEVTYTISE